MKPSMKGIIYFIKKLSIARMGRYCSIEKID